MDPLTSLLLFGKSSQDSPNPRTFSPAKPSLSIIAAAIAGEELVGPHFPKRRLIAVRSLWFPQSSNPGIDYFVLDIASVCSFYNFWENLNLVPLYVWDENIFHLLPLFPCSLVVTIYGIVSLVTLIIFHFFTPCSVLFRRRNYRIVSLITLIIFGFSDLQGTMKYPMHGQGY